MGAALSAPANSTLVQSLVALAKPGITKLVCLTSALGFVLALFGQPWTAGDLAWVFLGCMVGTAFSSAGANALNMWWERDRDACMNRTARRPIPVGSISERLALGAGLVFSIIGIGSLLLTTGPAPAIVALVTILSYVLVYTPLKPVTAWSTLIGGVPGALPPMIGWCAGLAMHDQWGQAAWNSLIDPRGWSLFGLMFVWQIPHFLAIGWMHREDFARGGHKVLATYDPTGVRTAWCSVLGAVVLIPATLAPAWLMPDRLGWLYLSIAIVTGAIFLALTCVLIKDRSRPRARAVFFGSIIHLPLLLAAIMLEVIARAIF